MKKPFAFSLICMGMLAACQPEAPQEPAKAESSPSQVESAMPPVVVKSEFALMKSEPIATEGVPNFSQDCNLEGVDGILFTSDQIVVSKSTQHEISGWLVNPLEKSLGNDLKLVIAGVGTTPGFWTSQSVSRIERAGVAKTRAYAPELTNSGFSFTVDMKELVNGEYHVYVMLANAGGNAVCDPGRQIKVID